MKKHKNITIKRMPFFRILAFLVTATVLFAACTKESSDVRLDPQLATTQLLNVTSSAATVVGFVVAQGDGFTEKGICYNTSTNPTISNSKMAYSGDNKSATFNVTLTGLAFATKYYARAYATGPTGTVYGEEYNFTTLPVVPVLTTAGITAVTSISAIGGGNVTLGGGAEVTVRGICFGTNHLPTIADSKTTDDKGVGEFVSSLSNLKGNTTYYVRAYATNSAGTGYGPEVSFTTPVGLPVVSTTPLTGVTKVSAVSGGEVTYDGGGTVTERGLVWGSSLNPTTSDHKIAGGSGLGAFVSNLEGLTVNTVYHIRSYATNSAGTAYGADIQFSTLADITKLWVVGDYNGWDNSNAAKFIISTATSNGDAEGYVFLKKGGIKLVTDHSWSDPATFGDDGAGKLTNPGGNITVAADGYYFIKANIGTMTYSLTLTNWGVIGSASPLDWNDETPLSFDATTSTWRGAMHLKAAEIKFRANHDWGFNYGSSTKDANLNAGGDNIAISVEADYAIVLDLSHPNAYTYSANRWGLIGDATPGSWDTSTPMTWDAAKKVFTVSLVLKSSGQFKFRANDAWTINMGGSLDKLTQDGANIPVPSDGNYTVTFDPWGLKATLTKN